MSIPVKQAEGFAIANGLKQVIIFGHDGENTHVLTWGDTVEHSAQAAAGANHVKKQWGWPAVDVVESEKVKALRARIAELEAQLPVQTTVHVIEGTEYERGWGCRPDGFAAFPTEEAAKAWIRDYDRKYNNLPSAPDEYTKYEYLGLREASPTFVRDMLAKGLKFYNRSGDLIA